jgi:two-component system sensor histidine kinase HydH
MADVLSPLRLVTRPARRVMRCPRLNRDQEKAHALRTRGSRIPITVAAGSIVFVTAGQYLIPGSLVLWHSIFQHLYVLPVVFAALYLGWRGGLIAAALAAVLYTPHILGGLGEREPFPGYMVDQAAEVVDFFLAGLVMGVLADRERRRRRDLQQKTEQLSRVYRELQDNFERMKRAERLYAVGQLSAGLAHEIRNPLAGIEGAAAVLQQDSGPGERRHEFLEIIQKECRRLNRLLTNFLDFARPRAPAYLQVDVGQLIDSVMGLAAHAIGRQNIVLRKDMPANLPALECDPEQLKQVLLNLTINAIQAMPNGGEVVLAARQQDAKVLIQIGDQGGGISAEDLDKIFDPFFTTKEDGTGLGLSVAYQIVGQHGGVLTAENNLDKGTTFSVLLPLQHERAV